MTEHEKLELKKQFKRALTAIFNKLGSSDVMHINFAQCFKIKDISITGDGAAVEYDDFARVKKVADTFAEGLAEHGITNGTSRISEALTSYIYEFNGRIFPAYIKAMKDKDVKFPLEYVRVNARAGETDVFSDSNHCLQAKNLPELVQGINAMLYDLGINNKEAYIHLSAPEQGLRQ